MSEPGKAVFFGYASHDAEAAKRICEALRVAGDDSWDHRIRNQITDCALLVPIISADTQARADA